MSTAATPTTPSQLTSDQLTVIVAAFSGLVFFVVIVVLLSIYRKEPHCCKDTHGDMDAPPQYYSSRQTLVGNPCLEQTHDITHSQSGQLFLIGLPSSYRLPSLEAPLPRLPSYESVRKKDRQRQIHIMIADRFGLNGAMLTESLSTVSKMMQCFHFIVEPVKNITAKLKESRKRAKNEKREPLEENQLFIVELARDLNRVCQRSEVLENIWKLEDIWPTPLCRAFILEWASLLESKQKRPMQSDGWPEESEWRKQDLFSENEMENAKRTIINWTKDLRAQPEQSVWPGEAVAQVLEDLQAAWRSRHMPNLLTAMELLMWVLLTQGLDKEAIPQQWLIWKQRTQKIGAARYIPHSVWDWISNAAVEISLDLDTANPDLLISNDEKKMRCGFDRKDVPNYHQRFDGWWCATGVEGFNSGRHYWEVEVGERDFRLGVAKESALRKGFKSLNTDTGYLTLRLERGTELKALTVPFTALPPGLIPRKVAVYLDYDQGQLSFYDVDSRSHIYTYNESFNEKLFPLFGTTEIIKDLVIKSPGSKAYCLCPSLCLWG
ncbi:E3 ubiquitin-protein ligase TRIM58-like isoform X1 [Oncorhynchus masou masou]|uniref:E3 ubiquitin-protein ligase TRIM58-like isoform X1 n=1 Tax=Oncorhynchus masou masou TaxID=90313 RepID=UPI0031834ECA